MANRPPSELFLPKPSIKRRRDDNIEHEILQRLHQQSQSSRPNTDTNDTVRRHTLGAIVEQKWAELHSEDTNDNPQQQPTSNHDPLTPASRSATRAQTPDHPSSFLFDATPSPSWLNDARHNLRETSQTRATLTQKAADLYATASGVIPPYI
ncbi:hypothetical protein PMZ80_007585 [Knufia obscura]|uniref:Uncharacterized protein n=2 Tax=Knufia TaxID=430999 RepID=A0AAN8ELL0_9EURO|nr:hypothetical protein PMZ80_007585 [Knufia obscura]KAK5954128.1 hypothetical protein OHC33_004700 [Knufia fluminis]